MKRNNFNRLDKLKKAMEDDEMTFTKMTKEEAEWVNEVQKDEMAHDENTR